MMKRNMILTISLMALLAILFSEMPAQSGWHRRDENLQKHHRICGPLELPKILLSSNLHNLSDKGPRARSSQKELLKYIRWIAVSQ